MALPPPTSLTPSKVAAFKDCALAFRYSVIDRLPEPPAPWSVKGTLVHRALELLHAAPPAQRTLELALEALGTAWAEAADDPEYTGLELSADDDERLRAEAEQLVRRYFDLEDPTSVRPAELRLEEMLEVDVGGLRLRGVIDRLEIGDDGEVVVTDYKTGKVPGVQHEQSRLGGVHFYAYLCQKVLGRRPTRVQLLYLSQPVAIVAEPSEQSIRALERRVGAVWDAVTRACERDDFRPHPSRLCRWCAFRAYCPAVGGDPALVAAARPVAVG